MCVVLVNMCGAGVETPAPVPSCCPRAAAVFVWVEAASSGY